MIACLQIKPPDLRGGDINVLRTGEITEAGRTEKTIPFGHDLQHSFRKERSASFRILLKNREHELVLLHGAEVLNAEILGLDVELGDRHRMELRDVDRLPAGLLRLLNRR